ncbi:MAG: hypothetical protein HYW25_05560 [Candidatus Aenigmarchaeota archaeon]|nr:hypothetical protein [Candidatus Aenigmarchaeota archaeon]
MSHVSIATGRHVDINPFLEAARGSAEGSARVVVSRRHPPGICDSCNTEDCERGYARIRIFASEDDVGLKPPRQKYLLCTDCLWHFKGSGYQWH